eukprot:GILJ01020091.1.p1 GENE.GILJ01020091.1~~GILJ01020091.1.p1  ORF type:complete len:233 (+),score=32.23 GILJ01020091.1:96-794(+)
MTSNMISLNLNARAIHALVADVVSKLRALYLRNMDVLQSPESVQTVDWPTELLSQHTIGELLKSLENMFSITSDSKQQGTSGLSLPTARLQKSVLSAGVAESIVAEVNAFLFHTKQIVSAKFSSSLFCVSFAPEFDVFFTDRILSVIRGYFVDLISFYTDLLHSQSSSNGPEKRSRLPNLGEMVEGILLPDLAMHMVPQHLVPFTSLVRKESADKGPLDPSLLSSASEAAFC